MESLKQNKNSFFNLKQGRRIVITLIIALFFDFLLFPLPTLAGEVKGATESEEMILAENNALPGANQEIVSDSPVIISQLPENDPWEVKKTDFLIVTAYNSEAGQCDSTPCITANGFNLCEYGIEDTVAANFLPFGAKIRMPELFGDKIFIVRDRMNARYDHRIDVWMKEKNQAVQFGAKVAKIEILK